MLWVEGEISSCKCEDTHSSVRNLEFIQRAYKFFAGEDLDKL